MKEAMEQALEVLTEIMQHFDDGSPQVYAGALLFEDERTLHEHVTTAVMALDEELNPRDTKIVPRSQRRRYATNALGKINGYVGKRKVKEFVTVEDANRWVNETE